MRRTPALQDWIRQARRERVMAPEHVAELLGVTPEEVHSWESGRPIPEHLRFPLTCWLETGYLPDRIEPLRPKDDYPWRIDPRA
ncbi:MAG: helix-turn-helix transcriptional regulator [Planctomycetes bacterium]|nr:helix-turn-helix transcriptional regulator [Planctomycetota bacterium]